MKSQTKIELEQRATAAIAEAVEFTATIRAAHPATGLMQNFTVRRATLAEAREMAARLEAMFQNGRKALVYAVSPLGFSELIPSEFNIQGPI